MIITSKIIQLFKMGRYLLNFSYIGTYFRGAQKQTSRGSELITWTTVQECIETALRRLRPVEPPILVLSSRTDSGVHALDSTAHFDIRTRNGSLYDCDYMTNNLNYVFNKKQLPIVINNIRRVPNEFSARFSALSRSYLYRIAVPKSNTISNVINNQLLLPVEEWRRSYLVENQNFEIDKFKEAAKLFEGIHDFRSFKKTTTRDDVFFDCVRNVYSVKVSKGLPLTTSHNTNKADKFDFWDINIRGKSFVHNQVRRMVGVLSAIAIGKLNCRDVKIMLQVPSKHSWDNRVHPAPAWGLYLTNVEYNPKELIMDETVNDNK